MGKKQVVTADGVPQKSLLHKIFGSTPGDGEMQPKEAMSYSWCGFGQNLICTIIGSYITVFMTDAIGFSALAVALLMLGARVFDAMNDPIMGSIVDRTRTPFGKCRPYLKWMALPIAIMTVICFLPWYPNTDGGFAALSIMYIVWGIIYTIADVPYWGLSTAMSNDTFRRGNMLTVARLFCTVGAGLVTLIVPMLTSNITAGDSSQISAIQNFINALSGNATDATAIKEFTNNVFIGIPNLQTYIAGLGDGAISADIFKALADVNISLEQSGADMLALQSAVRANMQETLRYVYFITAIVCVVIAVPLFFLGFKNTKERNQTMEAPPSLAHNLKLLFKNKPLVLIVLSGILGAGRMLFTYTGGLYFAKYVLADVSILGGFMSGEGLYTLFTLAVVPGGLIASLLVPYFTKKVGKRNTYIWSHVLGGAAMMIAFIVGITTDAGSYTAPLTIALLVVALVVAGIPSGFGNIITYAMIGDTVEYLEYKTGERAEGICFAMQTFINKIGMAVGAFVGVLAYFIADVEANNPATLTPSDKDTMWIMLVLIAAISFFLTVIPLLFYKFNEKEQVAAAAEIKSRKDEKIAAAEGAENADYTEIANDGYAPDAIMFPNADGVAVPSLDEEITAVESENAPEDEDK